MNGAELLAGRRICVCVGAGGVGKTTTAAALALGMAARGLKVAVVTIDPARRLGDALGVDQLDNEPRPVDAERLAGIEMRGQLWAMMLDPKRTFDDLIDRVAPTPERAAEIKRNGVYRELSSAVSGSQEFTAIEKLYELAEADYDLLVLDTPPAHNAAEFLNAPGRLTALLESGALQALQRPSGIGMRLLGLGAAPLLAALKLVTGVDLVSDLAAFFTLLGGMTEEFNARAARVQQLLHAPETAFVLVTSAQDRPILEAIRFRETLRESRMPFVGAIVNRVTQPLPRGEVALDLPPDLAAAVASCAADHRVLAERDAANIERLRDAFAGEPILRVPDLSDDIHDVEGLLAIHRELFR
ncbi:MAG TPA: ArsA-related P-loop ATPase [Solirubrobacteraceae bacterium]|nr:ArsA-related P-loop ATPase [Solirubrobacteraceae bacterium]